MKPPIFFWVTRDGGCIRPKHMGRRHLENAIRLLVRWRGNSYSDEQEARRTRALKNLRKERCRRIQARRVKSLLRYLNG